MKTVHLEGIHKRFRRAVALTDADLSADRGEVVGITGSNGAGKTTLLRVAATLLLPDAGTGTVGGFDIVRQAHEVRRRIGVVLVNERALYWRLSGIDNLRFFARLHGLSRRDARAAALTAAAALGMETIARRRVSSYSAGQRQRLVLARAIVAEPSVLMLDEPLRGLDDEGIGRVRALIRGYAAAGNTVLIATPTLTDVEDLFDQVYELAGGAVADHREIERVLTPAGGQS